MESADTDKPGEGFALSETEVRVLGVLIEKSFLTPDNYPLSVNALLAGCNQLTAREPVMQLSEAEVQDALDALIAGRWVTRRDQAGARVAKYEHQIRLRHSLTPPQQTVLTLLLLRGPQTAGEIRQRSERMHRFHEIAEVEEILERLQEKFPSMATALPRTPGTKETRYVHLLCGAPDLEALAAAPAAGAARSGRIEALEEEVARLRGELEALQQAFAAFRKQFE